MICPACSRVVDEGCARCPFCGAPLAPVPYYGYGPPVPEGPAPAAPRRQRGPVIAAIIAVALVLALLASGTVYMVKKLHVPTVTLTLAVPEDAAFSTEDATHTYAILMQRLREILGKEAVFSVRYSAGKRQFVVRCPRKDAPMVPEVLASRLIRYSSIQFRDEAGNVILTNADIQSVAARPASNPSDSGASGEYALCFFFYQSGVDKLNDAFAREPGVYIGVWNGDFVETSFTHACILESDWFSFLVSQKEAESSVEHLNDGLIPVHLTVAGVSADE